MSIVNLTVTLEDAELDAEALQENTLQICQEIADVSGVEMAELIPITTIAPNTKGIGGFVAGAFRAIVTSDVVVGVLGTLSDLNAGRKVTVELERTVGDRTKRISIKVGSPEDLEKITPQIRQLLGD